MLLNIGLALRPMVANIMMKMENIKDEIRTEKLSNFGIKILRFSDHEILNNIEGIVEVIQEEIGKLIISPHLDPLPVGERRGAVG